MKFAVTPFSIESINDLCNHGADIFVVGTEEFSNRLAHSFTMDEIETLVTVIHQREKEVYISANMIVHHSDLEKIESFLGEMKKLEVDGIIFGDLAVYQIAKRLEIQHLLIYNPETLNTNYFDPIFWDKKGIKGLTISKEITLDDIKKIAEKSTIEISIIGHGHLNMFHSRRPLIENFFKYNKDSFEQYIENRNLKLVEEIRDEAYPIFQDIHGTHIFRDKALESYQEIITLSKIIDVFIVDGIFKDTNYMIETMKNYQLILQNNDPLQATNISKHYESDHDSGFLYKKTVYDK